MAQSNLLLAEEHSQIRAVYNYRKVFERGVIHLGVVYYGLWRDYSETGLLVGCSMDYRSRVLQWARYAQIGQQRSLDILHSSK